MNVEPDAMALTPAEKMRRLRARRKKDHQCTRCGAKVRKGANCKACNAEAAEYVYESRGKTKK